AGAHALQYLGDTSVKIMFLHNFSQEVAERLSLLQNQIHQEQFLDFIDNRRFRSTMLCRAGVQIANSLTELVQHFAMRFLMSPQQEPLSAGAPLPEEMAFVSADGSLLTVSDPLTIALFDTLAQHHHKPLFVTEVLEMIQSRFGIGDRAGIHFILLNDGIRLFTAGLLTFHADAGVYATSVSTQPMALPVARYQAQITNRVVNGRHQMVDLTAWERALLQALDGQTPWTTLVQCLQQMEREKTEQTENGPTEEEWQAMLRRLAKEALLLS
ncbi:MAG: methyltransferase regulatory domain-containing protein, partial [Magnetococcales bacterium]|nr:methyltransferase regulatory domain-containing protein [Magnetococcales bacterium]